VRVFTVRPASFILAFALAACALAVSCSLLKRGGGGPEAQIVVGSVSLERDGARSDLEAGARFAPGDAVATARASKLKIASGTGSVFVNESASFKIAQPTEAESCVVVAAKGEYYFSARNGGALLCRFGDISVAMLDADAALTIDTSGRLAEFFVLNGRALVTRGNERRSVAACRSVVLDAAGISESDEADQNRFAAIARLKGWVGETVIEKASASGGCRPEPPAAPVVDTAGEAPEVEAVVGVSPEKKPRAAAPKPAAPLPPDTLEAKQFVPQKQPVSFSGLRIEHILGPRQIYVGEDFSLKCNVAGVGDITGYLWRFRNGDEVFEKKTVESLVAAKFEKTGESAITCEVLGENGVVASSQQIRINIVPGQTQISAGGPYSATLNRPAKLLGNAKSRGVRISRYEWHFTLSGKPDFVSAENVVAEHTFTKSGQHRAIFVVRLVDGAAVSDTAVVNVASAPPKAKAGGDVVSTSGRKVKLNGTGVSPNSKIVKYEWDFDGDGVYDWSSETSGAAEYAFKAYSYPVFRVTDTEGVTASDTVRVVICPKDMATVAKGKFCVDKYEWPNRRGETPLTNVSWHEAAKACADAGKRLCTASEWMRACRNDNEYKPADGGSYPYGNEFDDSRCNSVDNAKPRNALAPSGAFGECAGSLDIFDMSGNAAEWVASPGGAHALGGFYQSGAEASTCDSDLSLDKDRKYLYTGFRCCK